MPKVETELYPGAKSRHSKKSRAFEIARQALIQEWISGITGAILAVFIWFHLLFESSILISREAYEYMAVLLEHPLPLAQIAVVFITIIFFIHFVWASRKIPGKLKERKRMLELGVKIKRSKKLWNQDPKSDIRLRKHFETSLWIWQVRTAMIVLATGAFHLVLVAWNIFSDMGITNQTSGITADVSTSRVESGLWILYAILMVSVVAHMAIGVYRLMVKWFADTWFVRKYARLLFHFLLWFFIILGSATVLGLAGPLEGALS
jgi:fumarate reductase subunit C